MKLALINSVAGYGSTGRLVRMLGEGEAECLICYGRKSDSSGLPSFRMTSEAGFVSHVAYTFLTDRHACFNTRETERMLEQLKAFQPDLIHLHNLHGYYLDIRPLFAWLKESGIPVVWTLHDCWAFTGHCAHYTSVSCDRWKRECRDCPALLHYPPTFNRHHTEENRKRKEALFASLDPSSMVIVTPSRWLKEEASQSFLNRYEICTIPNGIDINTFTPRDSSFRAAHQLEGRYVILAAAGSWYKEKGTEDLIRLSNRLPEGSDLVVVGASGSFAQKLKGEHVLVLPRTESAEELAEIYSASDIFVNLTQEDTFPTVNLEAQACGCPILTYAAGGSTETVREGTGASAEAGNLDALIGMIKDNMDGRIRFDRSACETNGKQYSREAMIEGYQALYRRMEKRN
ncbi:MAG: glycosyltransferase [Solobacterium sp.]|nr:glycosyltransferase [Solobacterium sp.]